MAATQKYTRPHEVWIISAIFLSLFFASSLTASTQLLLARGIDPSGNDYKGVVELAVNPGFDDARVAITVDGQKITEALLAPYRIMVDFGPAALEHAIGVTATGPDKRKVQWRETINRGHLPLTVKVKPVDLTNRLFEAVTTAPDDDPITAVELWHGGTRVASATTAPYQFTVPAENLASGFVQVTARTKSGDEAADFWSNAGAVHVESIQVRTVPIFVSVVDRNGATMENVDRSLFRVMDNDSETKIVEFGKAFDQPISIALLIDASASMTYSMADATKAAEMFVQRILRPGDRCTVFAIQDVPRRKQPLTGDGSTVARALQGITAGGQTALYDSLESAMREMTGEKVRRAIVVLTDGADTSSVDSYDDARKAAMLSGIPIYFIAYDTGGDDQRRDLDMLRTLASDTGGFVVAASTENLQMKYREIEKDLRAQFAIQYQVTDYAKQNEWRRVRVVMASPKLIARTIRGYFAQ